MGHQTYLQFDDRTLMSKTRVFCDADEIALDREETSPFDSGNQGVFELDMDGVGW